MIKVGDTVVQVDGPRRMSEFIVGDVDGFMLHVKPKVHKAGEDHNYHWSHRDNYRELTEREKS